MPHSSRRALLPIIEWLLLAGFCCLLFFRTVPDAWRSLNTDFPNYYLAARLASDHVDTSRAYEWRWFARQKDHYQIDRALIGLVPITPFSTLAVMPLSHLHPLTAKRAWLVLQLLLLIPIALALRAITLQPLRRVFLIIAACLPLHRNLLFGQWYILLLALIVGACWALQRKRHALAGSLIAIAAAAKIFPIIFLVYFVRRKQWLAAISTLITGAVITAVSIAIFGWGMHRTYLQLVLPWTLRGEVLPPFSIGSSSLVTLLHCLLLYEPQWNPHPWYVAPTLYAALQAVLPVILIAPAILLVDRTDNSHRRIALEFSALLTATLTISTSPASYNFTLMILPVAVLCRYFLERPVLSTLGIALCAGICYPDGWYVGSAEGLRVALLMPRLFLLFALLAVFYALLGIRPLGERSQKVATAIFAAALALYAIYGSATGIKHQRGLSDDYAYRLPDTTGAYIAGSPQISNSGLLRIAMQPGGFRLLSGNTATPTGEWPQNANGPDQLSFAGSGGDLWVEEAGAHSRIVNTSRTVSIDNAESPILSFDGNRIAYLSTTRGHSRLMIHTSLEDQEITPESFNVSEAAFLTNHSFIVAATTSSSAAPHLFLVSDGYAPVALPLGEARYPAVSPDGRWLAYSRMEGHAWHLALLDLMTNRASTLTQADCNAIEPSWEADSKTLLYASDCGRALWFTAICRRRVVP